MSDRPGPPLLVVLGPSGAGKTCFCTEWCGLFPDYRNTDDLSVIAEYLAIDEAVARTRDPVRLREMLMGLGTQVRHTADVVQEYLRALDPPTACPSPRYCTPGDSGALQIAAPLVWDEAILRLARNLEPPGPWLVQMARGHDARYLSHFEIPACEVYPRALQLLLGAVPPALAPGLAIIHVTAGCEERVERNEQRRHRTGQHVPKDVMDRVFAEDLFTPRYLHPDAETPLSVRPAFFSTSGRLVPVVTVNNGLPRPEEERTAFLRDSAQLCRRFFDTWEAMGLGRPSAT